MFDNKDSVINELGNPLNISSMALNELEERLGGTKIVADPNSAFCFLMEFGSSVASACANKIDQTLPVLYPKRAMSMSDLFRHMSDYDYLSTYATPSSTTLVFALPKKYLFDNALQFNENYKKVTIPKDTVIMVGKYSFGLHCAIDILININTGIFTVEYDVNSNDGLLTLTKNIVDKYDIVKDSLEFLVIEFPIYQFAKSIIEESLIAEIGFNKKYVYNNYFYAVNVFAVKDGQYNKLRLTQSESVYDVTTPTALMRVLSDEQKIQLTIPQIYLDRADIGSRIYIELYTTMGKLDINTSNIDSTNISINFSKQTKDSNEYSQLLHSLPFDSVVSIKSDANISGGTNPIDFNTLRDRVVNNTLYETVPITAEQVEVYLNDKGFTAKKYLDNVTSRIWYAYHTLETNDGKMVPACETKFLMDEDYSSGYSTIKQESDGSLTVLPSTIYDYSEDTDTAKPLNDEAMLRLSKMNKAELVTELNNGNYFKSPFHLRVVLDDYYPKVTSYNLMTPSVDRIIFQDENYTVSSKMIAYDALIQHLNNGVGGYRLRIAMYKSEDLKTVDRESLKVYVAVKTDNNVWIGGSATYLTSTTDRDIYELEIKTNYKLTEKDEIAITNLKNSEIELQEYEIPLVSKFYVTFLLHKDAISGTYQSATASLVEGVPDSILSEYVGVSRQYFEITLGKSLGDVIRNNVEVSASSEVYAKWDHDVPATYAEDVYERNAKGELIYVIEDDKVKLNKLHSVGEIKTDADGNTIYLHKRGEVKYGNDGKPIIDKTRKKIYYVDLMLIDAKIFTSERSAELSFVENIYRSLEGYFDAVRKLQSQLLEQTYVYFKCMKSTGIAQFNMGNDTTVRCSAELGFKINCYVQPYVKRDETLQQTIKESICNALNEQIKARVINMQEIFTKIQEEMSESIDYLDLLGINGDPNLQTLEPISTDIQPILHRKLVLSNDNILSLEDDLEINFVVLNDVE